jgi:hypothetical protein
MSALPTTSVGGQVAEHAVVMSTTSFGAGVDVATVVVSDWAVGVDEDVEVVGTVVKEVAAAVVHATAAMLGLAATPKGEKTAPVSCVQLSIEQRGYENTHDIILSEVISAGL